MLFGLLTFKKPKTHKNLFGYRTFKRTFKYTKVKNPLLRKATWHLLHMEKQLLSFAGSRTFMGYLCLSLSLLENHASNFLFLLPETPLKHPPFISLLIFFQYLTIDNQKTQILTLENNRNNPVERKRGRIRFHNL